MSTPSEITLVELSLNSGDVVPEVPVLPVAEVPVLPVPEPAQRVDSIEPFQFLFYKTLDSMRIEWSTMIGLKYDYDHTKDPDEKKIVGQLMMLRAFSYKARLASFFDEVDEFLTNLE